MSASGYRQRALAEMRADPGNPRHGTHDGYVMGCRCERCRGAEAAYKRVTWGFSGSGPRDSEPWTAGDIRVLRANYGVVRCRVIARWLGRNPRQVMAMTRRLGLRSELKRGGGR